MSDGGRSLAEWTTFAVSCALVAAVVAVVALQASRPQDAAAPMTSVIGTSPRSDGRYAVQVTVRNEGSSTAANVQVVAELTVGGTTAEADQVIDFLAGHEEAELVFAFDDDPSGGELEVDVASFAVP